MRSIVVTVAVEGDTDIPVVQRVLDLVGLTMGPVHGRRGKGHLDRQLKGFNRAAGRSPWLVLRDLDRDAPCAAELVRSLLARPATKMCFRVAVRAAEAWLLADPEPLARYLGVHEALLPRSPENVLDPKGKVVDLARRSSDRDVREAMVPAAGTTARVGPGYTEKIIEFASRHWRPEVAARRADSLARCIAALQQLGRG